MAQMPSGTVTFLFSDVEGSTQLLERHGAAMGGALARHHELFEQIVERHGGAIFETVGDAVYAAFSSAGAAAAAAVDAQRALATEDWGPIGRLAVRIALHTGSVDRRGDHYFGPALFRVARLQALGYGEQTLLSGVTAGLAADALPEGASLRDLGSHRLKDLGEPEHVHQLVHPDLRAEFPALKSLDAHPHNLPLQLSSFVGREAEVTDVGRLLGQHRLVTLLGPGGIGKTRLALQAAAEALDSSSDGVFFVDLAPVRDPELVPGAIATSLGLRELPGQSISATVVEHLGLKHVLLVLDNLEQLLPAVARSVAELLAAGPHVRLLATSRAPLRVRGEQEYTVQTLAAGDPRKLQDEPPTAVALFVERARAIRPELAIDEQSGPLIAAICARLDGLPLAIELAAAKLRLFSLPALSVRLEHSLPLLTGGATDLPERHRTLNATIAWSEELLNEAEGRIFARLGVFVGGFTLEAAEAVAGPDPARVLDALSVLLEQSLLRLVDAVAGEPRYAMLETIREYALERLADRQEAEGLREAHADHYLLLSERARSELDGPKQQAWYRRLDQDLGNVRAAVAWAEVARSSDQLLRFGAALYPYWASRALFEDFRRWAAAAAPRLQDGSRPNRGKALHAIAFIRAVDGELDSAEALYEQAATLRREVGDLDGALGSLNNLGTIFLARGNVDAAEQVFRDCISMQPGSPEATVNLGECAFQLVRDAEAEQLFVEALRLFRERGDEESEVYTLGCLCRLAMARGEIEQSTDFLVEARRLNDEHGNLQIAHYLNLDEARLLMRTGGVARAASLALGTLKFVNEIGDKAGTADALDLLAEASIRMGNGAVAGQLWGAVDSLLSSSASSLSPRRTFERSELIRVIEAPAMTDGFNEALVRGHALDVASALALADLTFGMRSDIPVQSGS
jgi:predicted ATPase/class 3 adenylate cyclase